MKWIKYILITCIFLTPFFTFSQGIPIGAWRDHLPYNNCISVAESGQRIYSATPASLFYFDRSDNSLGRLNKVNGLSDIGITCIAFNKKAETLVITYSNANIDLIQHGEIVNMPDIFRKPILGNKTINRIVMLDKYAYLCCGFGIVVLDLMRNEIKDTYYIGPDGTPLNVYDIATDGTRFFAATESGIYEAQVSNPNLSNYASWTKDQTMIHPDLPYKIVTYFHGSLYANYSSKDFSADTMFVLQNNVWSYYDKSNTSNRYRINTNGDLIMFVSSGFIDVLDTSLNIRDRIWNYLLPDTTYYPQPQDALIDGKGHYWIADGVHGLFENFNSWTFIHYGPEGPGGTQIFSMSSLGNKVCAVPGGRNISWGNIWTFGGLYTFDDEKWTNFDHFNHSYWMDSIKDVVSVRIDPTDPRRVWAGTWGWGLLEFYDQKIVNIYEGSNSTLMPVPNYPLYNVKAGAIVFDDQNNMWVTNSGASNILSVRKASDHTWQSFNTGLLASGTNGADVGDLIIDNVGQKWMLLRGNRLMVYNDNGTLEKTSDDHAKVLTAGIGTGGIPGARVLSFALDKDGQVWLGTDEGVAVFYSPENVFTNQNSDAQRIYVTQDGYTQYLLETEAITAVAVDGSNKKWFGTERAGVYLMSADGTQQLEHFTTDNSPLLSNSISSIVINEVTGEVFIGTEKGLISFKGMATGGGEKNEGVYAYPNPVKSGYEGVIAVKGLVKDADVKITDINGGLVSHVRANGGQAIWNGRKMDGTKVPSGVYLVFISNDDGSETTVTKILFQK